MQGRRLLVSIVLLSLLIPMVVGLHYTFWDDYYDSSKIDSVSGTMEVNTTNGWLGITDSTNLVANPDVESGAPDDWFTGGGTWVTSEYRSYNHSLRLNPNVESFEWRCSYFAVTGDEHYIVSGFFKGTIQVDEWFLTIRWWNESDGTEFLSENNIALSGNPDWTEIGEHLQAPTDAESADILFRSVSGKGDMYGDDFFVGLHEHGEAYSVNLIGDRTTEELFYFWANATMSALSTAEIQFSADEVTWTNGLGEADAWDSLEDGENKIDITSLPYTVIYYHLNMTGGIGTRIYRIELRSDLEDPNITFWVIVIALVGTLLVGGSLLGRRVVEGLPSGITEGSQVFITILIVLLSGTFAMWFFTQDNPTTVQVIDAEIEYGINALPYDDFNQFVVIGVTILVLLVVIASVVGYAMRRVY